MGLSYPTCFKQRPYQPIREERIMKAKNSTLLVSIMLPVMSLLFAATAYAADQEKSSMDYGG
jgi:hypothetical protein